MNHGRCKNCWWYKVTNVEGYKVIGKRLVKQEGEGICYMHTIYPCKDYEEKHIVSSHSWCPDYCNRERINKQDKMTLDEWLKGLK
jgi:hypothetical protein